ncbi:hypothetical protein [Streptomyces caeruleatus]|uniref:Uncharacterized protein n=1 Tax=Streptomyces caeruleatus TaxID=661399 RepID=A0A117RLW0_9ACTN|nr:hypothetical protein [Streptomyces caeruleatus]KUN97981.1 hypothetical protein AQJ67_28820 [Streptomyces caeruleatus]
MLSSPEPTRTWQALPSALRRRVTARASLLWLIAAAALFALCLGSFVSWAAQDRAVVLAPVSGDHDSPAPGDTDEEEPEAAVAEAAAVQSASASPSILPVVVSGVSGFGGLLSGAAAMITVLRAADKGRPRQAPHTPQRGRDCGCRRVGPSPVRLGVTGDGR